MAQPDRAIQEPAAVAAPRPGPASERGGGEPYAWRIGLVVVLVAVGTGLHAVLEGVVGNRAAVVVALTAMLGAAAFTGSRVQRRGGVVRREREAQLRAIIEKADAQARALSGARDAALAAAKVKGDFVAVMSHEIRTPLNAILGFSGILLDSGLPAEQREVVRTIRSSGQALLAVVNDILDFSKIEAGRLTLEEAQFDIRDCMEDALELFATVAVEKELDLSCHVAADVPTRIRGDAARVRQILVNFVANAVKFTLRGVVEVHADAAPLSSHPDAVEIHCWVRDSGIGIPADRLGELFQAFTQADVSTTRRFGGTGLGLAICRSLAERMGGRVWAESTKGEGSTFHLAFPSRVTHETQTGKLAVARAPGSVVVVCPAEGTRRSLTAQAQSIGFEVVACASADDAVAALAAGTQVASVIVDKSAASERLLAAVTALQPAPRVVLLAAPKHDAERLQRLRALWSPVAVLRLPVRGIFLREALMQSPRAGGSQAPPTSDFGARPLAADLPLRVLVAEDNPVNQKVMQLLLDRLGYRADFVGNGVEAVAAVRAHPYDLVLMDMRMPEMDGVEATRRIRAELGPAAQPHIVALTANVAAEDRTQCLEAGMNDFLTKPIVTDELVRALRGTPRTTGRSGKHPAVSSVDLAQLRAITGDEVGLFRELIDAYLTMARGVMVELEGALERADLGTLVLSAHKLKGSAGQIGANAVAQGALALERAAQRASLSEARELFTALRREHVAASEQLQRERERA